MKTAFLFPGQGAQAIGMGKDIADSFTGAAEIFKKADDILGYELSKICFEGPAEKLNSTTISQPGIFVTSAAILEVLRKNESTSDITPDVTAGLSLGEYTALYAAGVISFEDGLELVQKRGNAMQAAADATDGAMVSIIGLDEDKVTELCRTAAKGGLLRPANFNCPGQIVISGDTKACQRAAELAESFGAIKAIVLQVAGAFHTEKMAGAAKTLKEALAICNIADPGEIKVLANVSGDYYQNANDIRSGLTEQLSSPILWQKCMQKLIDQGVEKFYEIGPGRVLTGLMKRIDRKKKVVNISTADSINGLLSKVDVS